MIAPPKALALVIGCGSPLIRVTLCRRHRAGEMQSPFAVFPVHGTRWIGTAPTIARSPGATRGPSALVIAHDPARYGSKSPRLSPTEAGAGNLCLTGADVLRTDAFRFGSREATIAEVLLLLIHAVKRIRANYRLDLACTVANRHCRTSHAMTMIEGRFTFEWPSLSLRSGLRSSVNRMVNGSARTALTLIVAGVSRLSSNRDLPLLGQGHACQHEPV
jgi:hypothetical protein